MKCPLKFSRYEFEGGTDCIGAECGFYGGVCMDATNGMRGETNGIADGITLPDGDAVAMLRKYANFWSLSHEMHTHTQCDSDWEKTTMHALADMVERDYVSRQDFEAQHRTLCAVREQRDEWKSKVKTLAGCSKYWRERCAKLEYRSDKRAAAVERLDGVEQATDENLLDAILGAPAGLNLHGAEKLIALKDLLTDDDAHSTTEPKLSEQSESLSDESDSREKLEDDVGFIVKEGFVTYKSIIGWLDRQAAITERKHLELACAFQLESDKRITELQAKVDELYKSCDVLRDKKLAAEREKSELTEQLEAAHAKNRALKAHISKMQSGRHGWHVKGVELQRQVDELTAQLRASNAERARLRECLGIATDNAHDFLALVDESCNVYDRDEGLA